MKKLLSVFISAIMLSCFVPCIYAESVQYTELNKFAVFTADFASSTTKTVQNLQITPGNANKYFLMSEENIKDTKFPINIDIDFGGFEVDMRQLVLSSRYGQSQGITNVDILVMSDGKWKEYMKGVPVIWQENWQTPENFALPVMNVRTDKLRIRVNSANMSSSEIRLDAISVLGKVVTENASDYIRPVYHRSRKGYPVRLADEVTIICSNGLERKLKTEWKNIPDGSSDGSFTVDGTVKGCDIPIKAVVDIYDDKEIVNHGGWAGDIYAAAEKAGYLVGIDALPYDYINADDAAKIIVGMLNIDLAYPKDYRGNGNIFRQTVMPYETGSGEYYTRLEAAAILTSYAKSVASYFPKDTEAEFTDCKDNNAVKEALSYGIISNSAYFRPNNRITAAELITMCFGLKRTAPFTSITNIDNGSAVKNANSGLLTESENNINNADVLYIKLESSDIKTDIGFDFGYIDTVISKIRSVGKKIAFNVSDIDETCIKKLSEKYANSNVLAFIDAKDNVQSQLCREQFTNKPVYDIAQNPERDGRYSFFQNAKCRIFPETVSFAAGVSHDEGFMVHINWVNDSAVSYGEDIYPALTLKTQAGNIASVIVDESVNLKSLSTGSFREFGQFRPHSFLAGDKYKAYISLGTINGTPSVELPIDLENDGDNRYYIGDITLNPLMYIIPHDGIDSEGCISVDFVRNDYAGEFFPDNTVSLSFSIGETGKPIYTENGDYALSTDSTSAYLELLSAVINHSVVFNHKVKLDFDKENLTLRGKDIEKSELANRTFDVYCKVNAIGKGGFVTVAAGWQIMQKIGTLYFDDGLNYTFKACRD